MRENDHFVGQVEDYLVEFDGDTPLPGRVMDVEEGLAGPRPARVAVRG